MMSRGSPSITSVGGLPAWLAGGAVGEIIEFANTDLAGQLTFTGSLDVTQQGIGPRSLIDTWCAMVVDSILNRLIFNGGGHTDYAGNAVPAFLLDVTTPHWAMLRNNTLGSQINSGNTASHYNDGRPVSSHTYTTLQFSEALNKMIRYGAAARYIDGNPNLTVDAFDLTTNDWDVAGTYADLPESGQGTFYIIVQHPTTGIVYYQANGSTNLYSFNPSTNIWTLLTSAVGVFGGYTTTAVDTARNRILRLGGSVTPAYYDLSSSGAETTFSLSGTTIPNVGTGQGSLTYCADLDRFLYYLGDATQNVYRIHPTTWAVDLFPTSGATPAASEWQLMNRFAHVPGLNGCVFATSGTDNVCFMRTS